MSFIGHRCGCGHTDLQHVKNKNGKQLSCKARAGQPCAAPCTRDPESQVFATFDSKARPVETVIKPGGRFTTESGTGGDPTCHCGNCRALYTELTGIELDESEPDPAEVAA